MKTNRVKTQRGQRKLARDNDQLAEHNLALSDRVIALGTETRILTDENCTLKGDLAVLSDQWTRVKVENEKLQRDLLVERERLGAEERHHAITCMGFEETIQKLTGHVEELTTALNLSMARISEMTAALAAPERNRFIVRLARVLHGLGVK